MAEMGSVESGDGLVMCPGDYVDLYDKDDKYTQTCIFQAYSTAAQYVGIVSPVLICTNKDNEIVYVSGKAVLRAPLDKHLANIDGPYQQKREGSEKTEVCEESWCNNIEDTLGFQFCSGAHDQGCGWFCGNHIKEYKVRDMHLKHTKAVLSCDVCANARAYIVGAEVDDE